MCSVNKKKGRESEQLQASSGCNNDKRRATVYELTLFVNHLHLFVYHKDERFKKALLVRLKYPHFFLCQSG